MVHGIEIDVGEELGRLVAERQPAPALVRSEKRIAGEIVERFLLGVGTRNYELDETEGIGTVDRAGEQVQAGFDGRWTQSTFARLVSRRHEYRAQARRAWAMALSSSKTGAAGERVGNEAAFEDRLDDIGESVVHHAVAEWCGGDGARFGCDDAEGAVGAGAVRAADELALEAEQFR